MSLSWIKRAIHPISVDELVATEQYGKAIERMRKEFSQRYPSTTERQRYADVLVLAGRGAEAVPVLIGIADEHERYGFPHKALEALQRAAEIRPGHAEVKDRLESIQREPREAPAPGGGEEERPTVASGDPSTNDATEFVALDAEDPEPMRARAEGEPAALERPPDAGDADEPELAPPSDELEVVAVDAEAHAPGPPNHERVAVDAEEHEHAKPSVVPPPAVVDTGELEPLDADGDAATEEREHTKPSFVPPPAVVDAEELEPLDAHMQDHDTKPSFFPESPVVDPGELEPLDAEADAEEREHTRPSVVPQPAAVDAEDLEPLDAEAPAPGLAAPDPEADSLLPEEDLDPEEVEALLADGPIVTEEDLEYALTADAQALLAGGPAEDAPGTLEDDNHFHELLARDARALLSDGPTSDEPGDPGGDGQLDEVLATDARALLSDHPTPDGPAPVAAPADCEEGPAAKGRGPSGGRPAETHLFLSEDDLLGDMVGLLPDESVAPSDKNEDEIEGLVRSLAETRAPGRATLGAVLFADLPRDEVRAVWEGLHPRAYAPGDTVVREGEPGHSVFLMVSGSVRILVMGGHGQPLEIRRIEAGDFFGEVAALSGKPRSATVVAATPCEMLEIDRDALDALLALRPAARLVLDDAWARRALSPEETAVRSLAPEAADPRQAAEALRAQFAGAEWSPRVRLHLCTMMLEAGRADDALATLVGVAEDLAQRGHAKEAIAILKRAGRARRRGSDGPTEGAPSRERVGALLSETAELAARATPPVEEVAEGTGEEQGDHLAG